MIGVCVHCLCQEGTVVSKDGMKTKWQLQWMPFCRNYTAITQLGGSGKQKLYVNVKINIITVLVPYTVTIPT